MTLYMGVNQSIKKTVYPYKVSWNSVSMKHTVSRIRHTQIRALVVRTQTALILNA